MCLSIGDREKPSLQVSISQTVPSHSELNLENHHRLPCSKKARDAPLILGHQQSWLKLKAILILFTLGLKVETKQKQHMEPGENILNTACVIEEANSLLPDS